MVPQPLGKTHYQYVDTAGFSYGAWKAACGGPIGHFETPPRENVAVVGAGLGGLAAAYELLRAGVNVTLFEASDRIGGRMFSKPFAAGSKDLAELGAMRFPPSEELLFDYINQFDIETTSDFPDPGAVETMVSYQGLKYRFTNEDESEVPQAFKDLSKAWDAFLTTGATVEVADATGSLQQIKLAAPNDISAALTANCTYTPHASGCDPVTAWQTYIDVFANRTLYNGLMLIFSGPHPPGGRAWMVPDDYERFAALGTGFGGFGPLYQVSFIDILRLMVNGLETAQRFLPGGISQVGTGLYTATITRPDGTKTSVEKHTRMKTPIGGLYTTQDGAVLMVDPAGKPLPGGPFARVIIATTHRAMEIDAKLGLFDTFNGPGNIPVSPALDTAAAAGVRAMHIMNSTKVFLRTESQFWKNKKDMPRVILSDSLSTNLYTLEYGEKTGVVLVSYVWGDESIKQLTFTDKKARMEMLRQALMPVAPEFAENLIPAGGDYDRNVQMIDWELEDHYYGAFKLNRPGQEQYVRTLFFDYQKVLANPNAATSKVFLAGDSISWTGGWTEGALQTAMNAACAVIHGLGGSVSGGADTPMTLDATRYDYNTANA
jgi:tryptophan 2-monooxygenase